MKNSKIILSLSTVLGVLLFTGCNHQPTMYSYETFPKNPNYVIYKPQKDRQFSEENLACMIKELEGKPYVWAEEGPNCFDCSGYLYYMFGKMGVEIPRVAREQIKYGEPIVMKDLKFGDFIFFDTTRNKVGKVTHVGIYLRDGWFSQASSAEKKITYGNLYTSKYYKERFLGARRYYEGNQVIAFQPRMQNYIAQATVATQKVEKPIQLAVAQSNQVNPVINTDTQIQKPIDMAITEHASTETPVQLAVAESNQVNPVINTDTQIQKPIDMAITEHASTEASAQIPTASDAELQKENLSTQQTIATQTPSTTVGESDTKINIHEANVEKKVGKSYYVQVGKFKNKPDMVFLRKIASHGYAYTIMPVSENGKTASKLLIGPFSDRNDANNTLISVKENIVKEAFVTKVSS
ncbi:MAG: NlpC/P60 family protein [Sulfurovaceae bacterium]|nr:NlpC/P60 family protein [Sulfurovaceae bacterium]